MLIDLLLVIVGFVGLLVGSITDIQKREVADWVNYFLIFSGLGLRVIYSLHTHDWLFLGYGILGFASFTALAYAMFYTGQWGGGDSKMLIAMGALFATYPSFFLEYFNPNFFGFPFLLAFWINLLLVGAVYGLLWTFGVGIFHLKDLRYSWRKWMSDYTVLQIRTISHLFALVLLIGGVLLSNYLELRILWFASLSFSLMIVGFFYLFILVKSVENSCMYRVVTPDQLVEGDWTFDDIEIDGKIIFSKNKKIGLETKDIENIKKYYNKNKIKKIKIKHGVPFVPSFLLSMIVTIIYGNIIMFFIL